MKQPQTSSLHNLGLSYSAYRNLHVDFARKHEELRSALQRGIEACCSKRPPHIWIYGGDASGCMVFSLLKTMPDIRIPGVLDRKIPLQELSAITHCTPDRAHGIDACDIVILSTAPCHYEAILNDLSSKLPPETRFLALYEPAAEEAAQEPFPQPEPILKAYYADAPSRTFSLVMLGDSITQCCPDWNELLGRNDVCNRGVGGDNLADMRNRLEHVTRMNPTTVFFMGGIVDLLNGRSFQDIRIDVRAILDTIISSGSNTIVHSTLPVCYPDNCSNRKYPPDYINASVGELNTMLADQCSALGIDYVDLHPHMTTRGRLRTEFTMDGIHLNMAGYTVWRDVLVHQYGPRLEALG